MVTIACSQDADAHLLMQEVEQCKYTLVVYSPLACHIKELEVSNKPSVDFQEL